MEHTNRNNDKAGCEEENDNTVKQPRGVATLSTSNNFRMKKEKGAIPALIQSFNNSDSSSGEEIHAATKMMEEPTRATVSLSDDEDNDEA